MNEKTNGSVDSVIAHFLLLVRSERSAVPAIMAALAVFILFSLLVPEVFLSTANMVSIGFQLPEIALLGMGVMLSMVLAGIDLSVVAIADLSSVAMVAFFHLFGNGDPMSSGLPVVIGGVAVAILVGAVCGAINGFLIGKLRITAILATLGTMELYSGLAMSWTGGHTLLGVPQVFMEIGNMVLWGVPVPAIIFLVCALLTALLLNGSRFGLRAVLVGSNPKAARLSGIREPRIQIGTYVASGMLAAVAGVIFVTRTAGATPDYGAGSYILLAVVIAILAGVNPYGGFGTVLGVVFSALILVMIRSGFVALGVNQFFYEVAQGGILIFVLACRSISRFDLRWLKRHVGAGRRRRLA